MANDESGSAVSVENPKLSGTLLFINYVNQWSA
jgi:hypothetical protein